MVCGVCSGKNSQVGGTGKSHFTVVSTGNSLQRGVLHCRSPHTGGGDVTPRPLVSATVANVSFPGSGVGAGAGTGVARVEASGSRGGAGGGAGGRPWSRRVTRRPETWATTRGGSLGGASGSCCSSA